MEVIFQCGDAITIPKGCKAIVKDGSVVFEKEEKVQEFKDGDVLHSVYADITLIFEKYNTYYSFTSHYSTLKNVGFDWAVKSFRHATEEEKAELFDKMKDQRLQWNAEEKRVEKIRWRANMNEYYYFVTPIGTICKSVVKNGLVLTSLERYEFFNQFRTEEQAEEAAKRVKETLMKYHEEIGE